MFTGLIAWVVDVHGDEGCINSPCRLFDAKERSSGRFVIQQDVDPIKADSHVGYLPFPVRKHSLNYFFPTKTRDSSLMGWMEDNDAVAVEQAIGGNDEAFRLLVERHSRAVFHLAFRMTGIEQDAEDVVQETFLRAYKYLDRFEERANFGTWLYRIAINCSLDCVRKRRTHEEFNATDDPDQGLVPVNNEFRSTPEKMILGIEVRRRVSGALGKLSALERTAFVLRHYEGMSINEIACTLGVQSAAAKDSVFRAVRKIRRALSPLVEEQ